MSINNHKIAGLENGRDNLNWGSAPEFISCSERLWLRFKIKTARKYISIEILKCTIMLCTLQVTWEGARITTLIEGLKYGFCGQDLRDNTTGTLISISHTLQATWQKVRITTLIIGVTVVSVVKISEITLILISISDTLQATWQERGLLLSS